MTKAVKTLGYRTMSPAGCAVTTEVMPTLGKLWHQRLRWQRGALENLRDYGWRRVTARYFLQQLLMGFGALSFLVYLTYMVTYTTLYGWPGFSPFWTAIGLVLVVEKTVSVRRAGWRAGLVAALMIPVMYGRVIGAGTTGAGGATLAATGLWLNSMAMVDRTPEGRPGGPPYNGGPRLGGAPASRTTLGPRQRSLDRQLAVSQRTTRGEHGRCAPH